MMKIGVTYDLRDDYRALGYSEEETAEFDSPETINGICQALENLEHDVIRIGNIRALAARLVGGETWDLVFNICEGLRGRSREAQVPALLEAYGVPYVFSDPLTQALTLDKAVAKRIVRDAGIPTAPFILIDTASDVTSCDLPFPLFVKPYAEGTGKGCTRASRVLETVALTNAVDGIQTRFRQASLVESFLPGREFTVGVVGNRNSTRVIGIMEILLRENAEPEVYSYANKEGWKTRVDYALVHDDEAQRAGDFAIAAYHALGCRDAARLDFRSDIQGVPNFIEANTLAGLHPTHSDFPILAAKAGLSFNDLIAEIMEAACQRLDLDGNAAIPEPRLHRYG